MKRANILLSHGVRGSGIEERHSGNDSSMLDIWGLAEIPPTAGEQKEGGPLCSSMQNMESNL
jgi:hypothetical protein